MSVACTAALPNGASQLFLGVLGISEQQELWQLWSCKMLSSASNAQWTSWESFAVPLRGGSLNSLVSVEVSAGVPQLFALDQSRTIWTCWKEAADTNDDWSAWQTFSSPNSEDVTFLAGVVLGPVSGGVGALLAATTVGNIYCIQKTSTVIGAVWGEWQLVVPGGPVPNSSLRALGASQVAPGLPQLWIENFTGGVDTFWQNIQGTWSGTPQNFVPPPPVGSTIREAIFASVVLPDGTAQVFCANGLTLTSWWKLSPYGEAGWSTPCSMTPPPGGMTLALTTATRPDGITVLIALTGQGLFSCQKESTAPDANWTNWAAMSQPSTIISDYQFSINWFTALNLRSPNVGSDTDYLTSVVRVNNVIATQYGTPFFTGPWPMSQNQTMEIGVVAPSASIADTDAVIFNYLIQNSGGSNHSQVEETLVAAATGLAKQGIDAIITAVSETGVGEAIGATIGTSTLPIIGTALGALAGWLIQTLGNIIFADCDGTVAAEQVAMTGLQLRQFTLSGNFSRTTDHPGNSSPGGCGSISDYRVSWTIESLGVIGGLGE
jgi:hypothetical protein